MVAISAVLFTTLACAQLNLIGAFEFSGVKSLIMNKMLPHKRPLLVLSPSADSFRNGTKG